MSHFPEQRIFLWRQKHGKLSSGTSNAICSWWTVIGQSRQQMGSHHHQAAILVPDDKLDYCGQLANFFAWSKMIQLLIWDQCCHLELMAPHFIQDVWPCFISFPAWSLKSSKLEMSDKLIDRRFALNRFVGDDVGGPGSFWYFFVVLDCHYLVLDGLDQYFQAAVHSPLTRAVD